MDNWSLRSKLILLTLLPTLLVVGLLSWTILYTFNEQLNNQQDKQSKNDSAFLASLVSHSLQNNSPEVTQQLIQQSLGKNYLTAIKVTDTDGNTLFQAGQFIQEPKLRINNFLKAPDHLLVVTPLLQSQSFDSGNDEKTLGQLFTQYNHKPFFSHRFKILLTALLGSIIALIILGYFANVMGKKTVEAINDFKTVLQAMSNGKFHSRIESQYGGEIQNLADTINNLGLAVQRNQQQLELKMEQATTDLQETLDTIEVQNIELNLARKEALQASKSKSDFLANTSHEIRTPLGGIIGFSSLLEKTELDSQQRDYIDIIRQSAENLHTIINDILDFSKIEAGKLVLDNNDFEIRPVLEHCVNIVSPLLTGKSVQLGLHISEDTPDIIYADALRLQQIVINLLANAAKFTHQGNIKLQVEAISNPENEKLLRFTVSDTGIGLDQQQQNSLFQAFTQADSSISRKYGGSGLGLSISKHLSELMGGEIGFSSNTEKGATFFFTIKPIRSTQNSPRPSNLAGIRILLLDNDNFVRSSLQQQLKYQGAEVHACEFKDRNKPQPNVDVIIVGLDHQQIGDSSPLTILEEIQEQSKKPVLALQPYSDLHHERIQSNNKNILVTRKPTSHDKLARRLLQLLGKGHSEKASHKSKLNTEQIKVLVVDDNYANLKLVELILEELGFDIDTAPSGLVAVELCKTTRYDLIFLDIQMPELDGYETVACLRHEENINNDTIIVALTAHALADEKRKILESGFNSHLTKPVRETEIVDTLLSAYPQLALEPGVRNTRPIEKEPVQTSEDKPRPVNITQALALSNNKADIARFMFTELLSSLPEFCQQIDQSAADKDYQQLLETTHKLHGAASYTGTINLKNNAQKLESCLKQKDYHESERLVHELLASITELQEWVNDHDLEVLFDI